MASSFSLILLIVLAVFSREGFPSTRDCIISILAGVLGALGLAALYFGLSLGCAALVAPLAGVVGAIIPILVGIGINGAPGELQLLGFVFGLFGIWVLLSLVVDSSLVEIDAYYSVYWQVWDLVGSWL